MEPRELLKLDHEMATNAASSAAPQSPAAAIYEALAIEPNAHKSEFLATTNPDLLLPSIRSHMLKGDFAKAEEKIAHLTDAQDDVATSEAQLETARLAAFRGLWSQCRELCNASLAVKASPLTHLSVMQVRAVALFELGRLTESLADVEMVLSQAATYPRAVAVGFSKAQRIKILMRTEGVAALDPELKRLWAETLATTPLNLDLVLVLLRLEIDRCRLLGQNYLPIARAAIRVSEAVGDRLYEGLAWLDLLAGLKEPLVHQLKHLEIFTNEFERIRRLFDDADLAEPATTSGRAVRSSVRAIESQENPPRQPKILLRPLGHWIDLEKPAAHEIAGNLEWLELAPEMAIGDGIEKSHFFSTLWQQKYVADLHDGVLRTFCSRTKSKSGVALKNSGGWLSLPDFLVV
jgi:hypothetical protein